MKAAEGDRGRAEVDDNLKKRGSNMFSKQNNLQSRGYSYSFIVLKRVEKKKKKKKKEREKDDLWRDARRE